MLRSRVSLIGFPFLWCLRRADVAVAAAILLTTGCATTPVPRLVTRDPPPVEMTQCQEEPPFPEGGFPDEASRYQWASSAIYAGRDCRARLQSLATWALGPAVGKGK